MTAWRLALERLQDAGLSPLLLDTQYRMHPSLAEFSSRRFYDGRLKSAVSPADRPPQGPALAHPQCPLAFVSVQAQSSGRQPRRRRTRRLWAELL